MKKCDYNHKMYNIIETLKEEEQKLVKTVNLKKGEILFHEGDICECVAVVLEGEISIVSYSYHGNEMTYNELKPFMLFGNNLLFSSDPRYKGSVLAKKAAKAGLIYKKDVLFLLKNNEEFLNLFLKYQSDIGKSLNAKIKLLSFTNAKERFLYYLYINNDVIEYETITKLASSVSLQRETLSRLISSLEDERIIKRNRKKIMLIKK